MKVLVVDDDSVILELAVAVLKGLGHEVLQRDRALGTSALIVSERPDVAIIDVEMPGLMGDELVRIATSDSLSPKCETAFIFYSGRDAEELAALVEETGAIGAITKAGGPRALAEQFQTLTAGL